MAKIKRLIFKVNNLEKKYGSISALDLKKLEIHPGTIYGIVGNVGSGKSTLLNILAGAEKESSGTVLYEDDTYKESWLGKIQTPDDIFYTKSLSLNTPCPAPKLDPVLISPVVPPTGKAVLTNAFNVVSNIKTWFDANVFS